MTDHYETADHFRDYDEDWPIGCCAECACDVFEDNSERVEDVLLCGECAWYARGGMNAAEAAMRGVQ